MSNPKLPRFADPLDRKDSLLESAAQIRKQRRQWYKEDGENLVLLAADFGIRRNDPHLFFKLSLELARKHYPARKRPGRRLNWTTWARGLLVVEIDRLRAGCIAKRTLDKTVINMLLQEPRWQQFIKRSGKEPRVDLGEFIRQLYIKSRKLGAAKTLQINYEKTIAHDGIEAWDALVSSYLNDPF